MQFLFTEFVIRQCYVCAKGHLQNKSGKCGCVHVSNIGFVLRRIIK